MAPHEKCQAGMDKSNSQAPPRGRATHRNAESMKSSRTRDVLARPLLLGAGPSLGGVLVGCVLVPRSAFRGMAACMGRVIVSSDLCGGVCACRDGMEIWQKQRGAWLGKSYSIVKPRQRAPLKNAETRNRRSKSDRSSQSAAPSQIQQQRPKSGRSVIACTRWQALPKPHLGRQGR
jgi:hypothetical protein